MHDVTHESQIRQSTAWYNPEIHQATGVIIAQTHADADEALRLLVEHAQSTRVPVDAVAADVIARRITFT
ncbi:ANTAR domain-containing protein [Cryobacterium sp. PAMC25264]|uniref:ANTAR domain-containing protein n=1 Tax=Cryobacterium sp. PAMC25264 TaxID=2861288 RepID=UPI001C630400|nr:ANTAR domain-containing protein [Cryobacterium sp. PAMC25264]QYF72283.1 ANTAR domain-containing protein [Cryobacterium sp. PAMC25264]